MTAFASVGPTERKANAWAAWIYAAVGAVLILLYFANSPVIGIPELAWRFALDLLINASAAVALLVGVHRWRPQHAVAWCLLAFSQAVYAAGDFVYYWDHYVSHIDRFPGLADAFYLGRVPFMVAGLLLILRGRSRGNRAALTDSLIIGIGIGLLSWVFLMKPYTMGSLGLSVRLTSLAYPVTDLILVLLAMRLLVGGGRRTTSFYLLTGGLVLLVATDSLYGWRNLHNIQFSSGSLVELGWLAYYVTVGACGLHPSIRDLAAPLPPSERSHSHLRLLALGAATLVGPALLIIENLLGQSSDSLPIALTSIAIIGLVIFRLADVMHHDDTSEALLRHQAFHDPLTGFANRTLFYDRLEHALKRSRREPRGLAILMIDLDRFKLVNDTLGHAAGDDLLITIARRISGCLRAADTAARLGGDEFVVLAEEMTTVGEAGALAQRVIDALMDTITLAGRKISVSASIGVAFAPTGLEDADLLVKEADSAMYRAKREMPGTYRVFEPLMQVTAPDVGLDVELRRALRDEELVVHYQPVASVETGRIVGVEALVRWKHPRRGLLSPGEFIPSAEASGIIVEIGDLVLRQACHQNKLWNKRWPREGLVVSVNISARELAEPNLVNRISQTLRDTGLEPRLLTLELTESALLVNPTQAAERLRELKGLGLKLALDDFGTSFSPLSHLRTLPVDCLKIDKSFVDTIATDRYGFDFVKGVVQLGHTLGLTTVAEGVEVVDQVRWLRHAGCDFMQGYLLARPLAAAEMETMIALQAAQPEEKHLTGVAGN